jgi:acid phosphatase type 7
MTDELQDDVHYGACWMVRRLWFAVVGLVALAAGCNSRSDRDMVTGALKSLPGSGPFLVKPYLQWGDSADASGGRSMEVLWHDADVDSGWDVEYRFRNDSTWRHTQSPAMRRIAMPSIAPHRLYRASLTGLEPGEEFSYRVRKRGEFVFAASGSAPKPREKPYRFVVFGDCGANTKEQREVAYQAYLARPDFVVITGDIVYSRGRISEYREKFWPVYNADDASPLLGAPLLRSTVFLAAPGNHDINIRDLGAYPDALAYFLYWAQPLNGPPGEEGSAHIPRLEGPDANLSAFKEAAGQAFPRMANFSFEFGNAHWTVLDANPYVDWDSPELQAWVTADLAAARGARWRFVALHQPGFNSAKAHAKEQNTRLLSRVFEAGKVDIVFCGHVHNYQRSFPMHFTPQEEPAGRPPGRKERVDGRWKLDRAFDGRQNTKPDGVIYLITGAGGASLYNPEQQDDPASWQEFTARFVSKTHSLTVAEVEDTRLSIRQLSAEGQEVDRFIITK